MTRYHAPAGIQREKEVRVSVIKNMKNVRFQSRCFEMDNLCNALGQSRLDGRTVREEFSLSLPELRYNPETSSRYQALTGVHCQVRDHI